MGPNVEGPGPMVGPSVPTMVNIGPHGPFGPIGPFGPQ
ncbi:unnamed protein product [Soboliphyme baturini]|uniref:Collagen-like protein n=1 Tax=Soboliphyme baturini TaxID=241478 RepID=A0A183J6R8_9BILA|nr:unnamed protein product [Soboliphyme baturini]